MNVYELVAEKESATEQQKRTVEIFDTVKQLIEQGNTTVALQIIKERLVEYPDDMAARELEQRLQSSDFCSVMRLQEK